MYMDWYCCGTEGVVTLEIAEAMAKEGWREDENDAVALAKTV